MSKLLKYNYKDIDFFYSEDMKEQGGLENVLDLESFTFATIHKSLILNKEHKELINDYVEKNNLEGIAILYANGDSIEDKWCYVKGEETHSIQRWISQKDGKYKLLIIDVDNPGRHKIISKKSPILMLQKEGQIELFLPGTGYVDSCLIHEEFMKLKKL